MIRMRMGKPLLVNLFGENNTVKVLDFLLKGKDFDFTLTHIHNGTGLSRTAVRNAIENLNEIDVVEISRKDSKSTYYKINKKSDKYHILETLHRKLMKDVICS